MNRRSMIAMDGVVKEVDDDDDTVGNADADTDDDDVDCIQLWRINTIKELFVTWNKISEPVYDETHVHSAEAVAVKSSRRLIK